MSNGTVQLADARSGLDISVAAFNEGPGGLCFALSDDSTIDDGASRVAWLPRLRPDCTLNLKL